MKCCPYVILFACCFSFNGFPCSTPKPSTFFPESDVVVPNRLCYIDKISVILPAGFSFPLKKCSQCQLTIQYHERLLGVQSSLFTKLVTNIGITITSVRLSLVHGVESPSMVDPQWNILYWGSKWNLYTVCWGEVGCELGTTYVYFGITYVCFIPSRRPTFAVEPQYQHRYFFYFC